MQLATFQARIFNLMFTRFSSSFSGRLLSIQMAPSYAVAVIPSQKPLNLMKFLSAHYSSLLRSFWIITLPFSTSVFPPSLVSYVNLLRTHSIQSPRSIIKSLNSINPSLNLWRNPLNSWLLITINAGLYNHESTKSSDPDTSLPELSSAYPVLFQWFQY